MKHFMSIDKLRSDPCLSSCFHHCILKASGIQPLHTCTV